MKPILLLLFAATAACVGALLPLISRARSKRLLLNAVRRASSDAPDGIGISVLCSGVTDAAQIENLLSPEYSRYEVIVVLDARRHAAEFAALTARYRMIRVEWVCSGELEVSGVRALGRSRRRCFPAAGARRPGAGFGGGRFRRRGVGGHLRLPAARRAGCFLLPGSVERLVAELGEGRPGSLDLIRSPLGRTRRLVEPRGGGSRRAVSGCARCGGPRCRRRMLWEPLLAAPRSGVRMPGRLRGLAAASLAAAFAAATAAGWWTSAAALATLALVWAGGECAARLAGGTAFSAPGGLTAWRRLFGHY